MKDYQESSRCNPFFGSAILFNAFNTEFLNFSPPKLLGKIYPLVLDLSYPIFSRRFGAAWSPVDFIVGIFVVQYLAKSASHVINQASPR